MKSGSGVLGEFSEGVFCISMICHVVSGRNQDPELQ
jgi:hypothetical protein